MSIEKSRVEFTLLKCFSFVRAKSLSQTSYRLQHVHIHPHLWLECKQVVKNVLGRFY